MYNSSGTVEGRPGTTSGTLSGSDWAEGCGLLGDAGFFSVSTHTHTHY